MKDYYLLLGIERTADKEAIKDAFRRSAKKTHPDIAGQASSTEQFRDVNEAYQTLTDDRRKQLYDRELNESGSIPITKGVGSRSGAACPVNPIFDRRHQTRCQSSSGRPDTDSGGIGRDWERRGSGMDRTWSDPFWYSGCSDWEQAAPFDRRPGFDSDRYHFEIRLSNVEAARGGSFPCRLIVGAPCPQCHRHWPQTLFCPQCNGTGYWRRSKELVVHVPSNMTDGTQVVLTLDHVGLKGVSLEVLIRVEPNSPSAS
jgi:DnaJ-class molecular chaperone